MRRQRSECQYCAGKADCSGRVVTPNQVFVCMRDKGHEGDHVACGTFDHGIKTWGQSEHELLSSASTTPNQE